MATERMKYLTGVALGLALFAASCEKKGEDAGPQSTLGRSWTGLGSSASS